MVEAGASRERAYEITQRNALRAWDEGLPFRGAAGGGRRRRRAARRAPRSTACSTSTASCGTWTASSTARSTRWRYLVSDQLADRHEASGKVREIYNFGETMLMVASDRMSAFDVIMPTPIPDKGRVLTALSAFWFERTAELAPNHLISIDPARLPRAGPQLARPGRPHDAGAAADDDADRVRRTRLPGRFRLEGLPRHRLGLRPAAACRPARIGAAAAADLHARPPRPPAATTSTSMPTPRRCWSATSSATRRSSGCRSTSTSTPPPTPPSAASSSPTPSSSSASTPTAGWCWATRC